MASDGKWYPPHQHPDAAIPPPPPPPGYTSGTNGYAVASLVLGIVWLWPVGAVLAVIFGYKARREIDQSGGRQSGRGMAVAGIVLGWIGIAGGALLVALLITLGATGAFDDFNSDPSDGYCNNDRVWQDPDC